ncbi:MAG: carbon-nitrogen family hydrolase [Methanoregulaceae archaeon]|nr:carbon-nitrogen family hydrolase [Methanoregulaceae archaeon]
MEVVPSHPEENLKKGEDFVAEAARRGSELICFPEMWTTGFPWKEMGELARRHAGILDSLCSLARDYHIWINGSLPVLTEQGRVANTSLLINPDGHTVGIYRKAHLFSLFHEEQFIEAGNALCLVDAPWGRTGLSICYDIRFPELYRTYALKGAGIVLLPAAFPEPRLSHWKVLCRARAIENQIFLVATNRVGHEEMVSEGEVTYFGSSVIIDPRGDPVVEGSDNEELLTATINMARVEEVRLSMRVFADRRPDLYVV